jgi:UDP-3-O-[3-hydroxymyristoyl] glucosamine N-acyltransferase
MWTAPADASDAINSLLRIKVETMSKSCVLFGVDSVFSAEVVETMRRLGFTTFLGVITGECEWDLDGIDAVLGEGKIEREWLPLPVVVPWVTPRLRRERTAIARSVGFTRFDAVLDPTATVASSATLGQGVFVNAGAILGSYASLGEGVTVNRGASLGHHTTVEDFAAIGPGATVAARCRIGAGAQLGAAAAVAPGLTVGAGSLVALGAAVIRDVPDASMVAGIPARVKERPS